MEYSAEELEKFVDRLNCTLGWLTFFGVRAISRRESLEKILSRDVDEASNLVAREIRRPLETRCTRLEKISVCTRGYSF